MFILHKKKSIKVNKNAKALTNSLPGVVVKAEYLEA